MKYIIDESGCLRGCEGTETELRLPEEVRSVLISDYGDRRMQCTDLKRLILPASVANVHSLGRTNIEELIIEGKETTIHNNACRKCRKLEKIVFHADNKSIRNLAFLGTPWLNNQPHHSWICDGKLICYAASEEEYAIPPNVSVIGSEAVFGDYNLKRVVIGNQVKEIGKYAFNSCRILEDVCILGDPYIDPTAFDDTPWLKKQDSFINKGRLLRYSGKSNDVTIPEGIEEICPYTFNTNSRRICSVSLPASVKRIDDRAFFNCTSLREIVIPPSVELVGSNAFSNCKKLEKVVVLSEKTRIEQGAFYACPKLDKDSLIACGVPEPAFVEEQTSNPALVTPPTKFDELQMEMDKDGILVGCRGTQVALRLPPEVRGIAASALDGCDRLERLILPPTVKWVESCALGGAKNLRELIIKGTQTELRFFACLGCEKLEHISFPNGNHSIDGAAFCSTPWLENQPYSAWIRDGELLCYAGEYAEYEIPSCVTVIGDSAFCCNDTMKRVIIGEQVKTVKEGAFHSCEELEDVMIAGAPPWIAPDAFDATPWLKKQRGCLINHGRLLRYIGNEEHVRVPDGVLEISELAFFENTAIITVSIPPSVIKIGRNAFAGCVRLRDIRLSEGLRTIGDGAFANCIALEEITLPRSIWIVMQFAFSNCKGLKRLNRPEHAIRFEEGAFYNCGELRRPAAEKDIPDKAF